MNDTSIDTPILEVKNLFVSYGAINAIRDVSFNVNAGEIVTLIGANGAGKTTALQSISNIIKKETGKVTFFDEDISAMPPEKIVRKRLIHSPEGRRIFANLTVRENIEMGAFIRKDAVGIKRDTDMVLGLFPRLRERFKQVAGTLSGGEQQMLAIARALMSSPKLLMLDEPSMGLSPILVDDIFSIIEKINASGVAILLVEQNAFKALSIANRAFVLETGVIVKSGAAHELLHDTAVKSAYLGA
ncbi:MAG: ABC transporter ATP-binding protein [Treponemataceae bacterium]|nr:MAG: ABC transporter ATP-binding protein [Treponemataceae bacterium]